ncbi:MAG TPA: hypothetical protein VH306_02705 [Gaiellaceae bacterium]|jgi:hypothetical protein
MAAEDSVRATIRKLPVTEEEDEFDPFAGKQVDSPPADEGDDRVHADGDKG